MRPIEKIVIDANALLSIVIGGKASRRIVMHPKAPAVQVTRQSYEEVEEYIPVLAKRRNLEEKLLWSIWRVLLVDVFDPPQSGQFWDTAWRCLSQRDPDDVPTLALALEHACPIWSQDKDFDEARNLCVVYPTARLLKILDES